MTKPTIRGFFARSVRRFVAVLSPGRPGGNVFHVNSRGQKGGITAGQVIYGSPKRTLGTVPPPIETKLRARPVSSLTVVLNNPDGETRQLAAQIDNLASQLGWPAGGLPGVLIGGELVLGIQVHSTASPSDLDDPLRVLAEWLWRREMALDFVHSAPSNAILLGPMP